MHGLTAARAGTFLVVANIIAMAGQLMIIIAIAQWTGVADLGRFGFVMALIQPIYIFALMGLQTNLATDANRELAVPTVLAFRSTAAVAFAASGILLIISSREDALFLALPLVAAKTAELFSDTSYGLAQRAGKTFVVVQSMLVRSVLGAVIFVWCLFATGSLILSFWAQASVVIGVLIFHDLKAFIATFDSRAQRPRKTALVDLLKCSLPLALGQFFVATQMAVPRLVVGYSLGLEALGLFTVVSYLERAATGIIAGVEQASAWRLSSYWASGEASKFKSSLFSMFALALVCGLGGLLVVVLLGEAALALMFGNAYLEAYALLVWMAAAVALRLVGAVLQIALNAQRRFVSFVLTQSALLIVTVPAALVCIAQFGLVGAGIAVFAITVLRVFALFVLQLVAVPKTVQSAA